MFFTEQAKWLCELATSVCVNIPQTRTLLCICTYYDMPSAAVCLRPSPQRRSEPGDPPTSERFAAIRPALPRAVATRRWRPGRWVCEHVLIGVNGLNIVCEHVFIGVNEL